MDKILNLTKNKTIINAVAGTRTLKPDISEMVG